MTVNEKIAKIRERMTENHIDAVIVPSADPHMSEYYSEHWKTRAWLSGFTGSAGSFVITQSVAGLWTDGRYYVQAEKQLSGSEGVLFKMNEPETPMNILQKSCRKMQWSESMVSSSRWLMSKRCRRLLKRKIFKLTIR